MPLIKNVISFKFFNNYYLSTYQKGKYAVVAALNILSWMWKYVKKDRNALNGHVAISRRNSGS